MSKVIHFYELDYERRERQGLQMADLKFSSQAMCSTGDGNQKTTRHKQSVTCRSCLKLLKGKKQ